MLGSKGMKAVRGTWAFKVQKYLAIADVKDTKGLKVFLEHKDFRVFRDFKEIKEHKAALV